MRNDLQLTRGAGALTHAVPSAALVGLAAVWLTAVCLASAGCDGSPVAERPGEDATHEAEVTLDQTDMNSAECELPTGVPSDRVDTPVANDIAPAAYDEPTAAGDSASNAGISELDSSSATASEATAEPAAQKPPTRPPADRTARRPGDAEKISFDDLNLGMAADMVYRPFLLNDRVKELDGQRVSILGCMHAGAGGGKIKEFVLLKNSECLFGTGGQADHLARVYLADGEVTKYQGKDMLKVEGKLVVKPYQGPDGNTWSIYDLVEAKVVR